MGLDKINDLKVQTVQLAQQLNKAIQRVLASGWFSLGPEVHAFEEEFATYCGVRHCVGVANGTDALELLLRAMDVGEEDEVITAANVGMYATTAILSTGATPIYADIDLDSLTLSPQLVAAKISPRTRVVIATHLFGRMADMPALRAITDHNNVALVEDCAQSHGASLNGIRAGAWGDGAAFSFYPTKNLGALGDGGAVLTSDLHIAQRVKRLRQYGWEEKYIVGCSGGRNSRLDEIQAAVLRVKFPFLDQWNGQRRAVARCYNEHLRHEGVLTPCVAGDDYVAHLYVVRSGKRDTLRKYLKQHDIAADIHYPVLDYQQPILRQRYSRMQLPNSEHVVNEILTLPCYPELDLDVVKRGCEIINRWRM